MADAPHSRIAARQRNRVRWVVALRLRVSEFHPLSSGEAEANRRPLGRPGGVGRSTKVVSELT
jgi:hypothetical protein